MVLQVFYLWCWWTERTPGCRRVKAVCFLMSSGTELPSGFLSLRFMLRELGYDKTIFGRTIGVRAGRGGEPALGTRQPLTCFFLGRCWHSW